MQRIIEDISVSDIFQRQNSFGRTLQHTLYQTSQELFIKAGALIGTTFIAYNLNATAVKTAEIPHKLNYAPKALVWTTARIGFDDAWIGSDGVILDETKRLQPLRYEEVDGANTVNHYFYTDNTKLTIVRDQTGSIAAGSFYAVYQYIILPDRPIRTITVPDNEQTA